MGRNEPNELYSARLLNELTKVIVERRHELGLSQEDFSAVSGFSRSYVSDIERGERSFGLRNLIRLSNALRLAPSELLNKAERKLKDTDCFLVVSALGDDHTFEG